MDMLTKFVKEGKLYCCSRRKILAKPSEVCVSEGCLSRLSCNICSPNHPPNHKRIPLEDFLRSSNFTEKCHEELFQISKKDFEKGTLYSIHQTKNLLKSLKKMLKTFDNWRKNTDNAYENFETNLEQLISKSSSKISNRAFSKIYNLITAAKNGRTENFLPDIPAEEWTLILQFGEKFLQDFRDTAEKMLSGVHKKAQFITIDGPAIKTKVTPFIQEYINEKICKKTASKKVIDLSSSEEEEVQDLTPETNALEEEHCKFQKKMECNQIELCDIEEIIKRVMKLPPEFRLKTQNFFETMRSTFFKVEIWLQQARAFKELVLEDMKEFKANDAQPSQRPQHPAFFKRTPLDGLKQRMLQRKREGLKLIDFISNRNEMKEYGFKLWEKYLEAFPEEEQFIKEKELPTHQEEASNYYTALKTKFITRMGLVFEEENIAEELTKFLQIWELAKELENFVLYLKNLDGGVMEYVIGKVNMGYLVAFPSLQNARSLHGKIREIGINFPKELVGELEEQISLAMLFQIFFGNQDSNPSNFERLVDTCAPLKLTFRELEVARKQYHKKFAGQFGKRKSGPLDVIDLDEEEADAKTEEKTAIIAVDEDEVSFEIELKCNMQE